MISFKQRLLWVAAYAVAMALLEAVVVVYLRALITIGRDHVTLGGYLGYELWREAGTLVMLVAIGVLAGHHWRQRLAYSLLAFGLWDIGYYAWLRQQPDWHLLRPAPFRWPLFMISLGLLVFPPASLLWPTLRSPSFASVAVRAIQNNSE